MTHGRERFGLRRALVVVQVALSLVLVAGALLFSRSLGNLLTIDTGYRQEGIKIATVGFQRLNLPPDRSPAFKDELLDRIRAIPGAEAVAFSNTIPIHRQGNPYVWMDGADVRQGRRTFIGRVGPDYFKTLEIPLLAGRDFDARDRADSPKAAIVNEAFARTFLHGANPLGQRFWIEGFGGQDTRYEIVGLVRDTKLGDLRQEFDPIAYTTPAQAADAVSGGFVFIRSHLPQSEIVGLVRNTKYADLREEFRSIVYYATAQDAGAGAGIQVLIRARLPQTETVAAVKRMLNEINPAISVSFQEFKTMIEATLLRERLMATLSGFFGLLSLLLACIGLYGMLSYGVASRTNEIGIRMALGAQRRDVLWLILREALLVAIAGVVVGAPLIFAVTRLASTLLYGLTPTDPVSLLLAALLMLAVALVAGYLPSRRATRLDPMIALRCE